jgi:hypothetical protein
VGLRLMRDTRLAAHIEFQNTGNHSNRLRPVAIFEQRVAQRFCAAHEQAAAYVLLVLNNPIAASVLANKEKERIRVRCRRGRFLLAHDTSPFTEEFGALAQTY